MHASDVLNIRSRNRVAVQQLTFESQIFTAADRRPHAIVAQVQLDAAVGDRISPAVGQFRFRRLSVDKTSEHKSPRPHASSTDDTNFRDSKEAYRDVRVHDDVKESVRRDSRMNCRRQQSIGAYIITLDRDVQNLRALQQPGVSLVSINLSCFAAPAVE